jgi:cellulose synthase operon protein C
MMTELIAIRGPAPSFLDTRAVVYIVKGNKTAEAIKDLDLAELQQDRAVYHFHKAWVYYLMPDKRANWELELDKARQLGLTIEDLHPLEVRQYGEWTRKK